MDTSKAEQNKRLALKLLWIVAGAIVFAISLVPLYNVLCQVTGLNGKTGTDPDDQGNVVKIDQTRWVTVEFTGNVMPGLGWNFSPNQTHMRVRPGQIEMATFVAKNNTNREVVGQAVPSVTPGQASLYFKKIECFCFERQALQPGESKEMPLRFYVSPDLPEKVEVVTLSYSFFNAVPTAN